MKETLEFNHGVECFRSVMMALGSNGLVFGKKEALQKRQKFKYVKGQTMFTCPSAFMEQRSYPNGSGCERYGEKTTQRREGYQPLRPPGARTIKLDDFTLSSSPLV